MELSASGPLLVTGSRPKPAVASPVLKSRDLQVQMQMQMQNMLLLSYVYAVPVFVTRCIVNGTCRVIFDKPIEDLQLQ